MPTPWPGPGLSKVGKIKCQMLLCKLYLKKSLALPSRKVRMVTLCPGTLPPSDKDNINSRWNCQFRQEAEGLGIIEGYARQQAQNGQLSWRVMCAGDAML